jgi:hypothetical protein
MPKTSVEGRFQLNLLKCWRRFAEAPFKGRKKNDMNLEILTVNQSLLSPHPILKKKKKWGLADFYYFFLYSTKPTIAIAITMTTMPIARYVSMSELEIDDCAEDVEVDDGELVAAADATVAKVCA